jgi:hypothetical protein
VNEIYSNADTAQRLGIAVNSLNKRRSRMTTAGTLSEGKDWFKQDDGIFWTAQGLAAVDGDSAALVVPSEGQALSLGEDVPLSLGEDIPSPAAIAAAHAPAIVSRYLAAVDDAMASEVTRLLSEGDSLKKHLASRWGIEAGAVS